MTGGAQLVSVFVFLLVLEVFEFFAIRKESSDVFSVKTGWRVFYVLSIGALLVAILEYVLGSRRPANALPLWFLLLLLALCVFSRPKMLGVNSSGVASFGLWGLRRRFIAWTDVRSIESDWQEAGLWAGLSRLWLFTGYEVSVVGMDGRRIDHTIFLRSQRRFLDDLRQHVRVEKFAPGLADWHP